MSDSTDLLVIGAGPFGLALARWAARMGLACRVVGTPMAFWRTRMPAGMRLRSGRGWHLDPWDELTLDRFLDEARPPAAAADPISRDTYLAYAAWFEQRAGLHIEHDEVARLDGSDNAGGRFVATLSSGRRVRARAVVVATGFDAFAHAPRDLTSRLPDGVWSHTRDYVDFGDASGRRFLVIGGRQSAFEWAALIREAGAAHVHVAFRHDTPAFAPSDWSWVSGMVDRLVTEPGWFGRATVEEQAAIRGRFWAEGRLKLEPWLAPRIHRDGIAVLPRTQLQGCERTASGSLVAVLDDAGPVTIDRVVLATGYAVDVARVEFIGRGNLGSRMATANGYPVLDAYCESTVPGLFWTSIAATQSHGPFFAFTVSARASAHLIGGAVSRA